MSSREPWLAGPELAAIWQRATGETFALSRATHGLTLIRAVLARRGIDAPEAWVPAYFCENGLGPFRHGAARLRFYPVRDTMSPDWSAVERMVLAGGPHLFVLPHFFGVENEVERAREFCDRTGALLLEDAAHVLRPVGTIGRFGDFTCYSPRKFFAVPDAGILVARGEQLAREVRTVASRLETTASPGNLRWHALALRDRIAPRRARRGPLTPRKIDDEPQQVPLEPAVWMSEFSRRRIARLGRAGAGAIAGREAATVAAIEAGLRERGLLSPLPRHPGATPYMLGFRAATEALAAEAFAALRREGADVATWPGLPMEVWSAPDDYGRALALRRTVLRFTPRHANRRDPLGFLTG